MKKNKVSRSPSESRSVPDGAFLSPCPLAHWTVAFWDLFAVDLFNIIYPRGTQKKKPTARRTLVLSEYHHDASRQCPWPRNKFSLLGMQTIPVTRQVRERWVRCLDGGPRGQYVHFSNSTSSFSNTDNPPQPACCWSVSRGPPGSSSCCSVTWHS